MLLSDLNIKQKATILQLNCSDELKQRFYSFGIIKGTTVIIERISLAKNTIALIVDDTNVAIRFDEAQNIKIKLV